MNTDLQKEEKLTLDILSAIDNGQHLSQRRLANEMGVALGLANSYVKKCVKRGWVKINEAPANRYVYYLTPKGFTEKTRLTARFLSESLGFYRKASDSCSQLYTDQGKIGNYHVVLCGDSELAEIAYLSALRDSVEVVGLYDPITARRDFFGLPVWSKMEQLPVVPRVITCMTCPDLWVEKLSAFTSDVEVLVPDVLGIRCTSE